MEKIDKNWIACNKTERCQINKENNSLVLRDWKRRGQQIARWRDNITNSSHYMGNKRWKQQKTEKTVEGVQCPAVSNKRQMMMD